MLPLVRLPLNTQLRLVYDLPVPYSRLHPVALELAQTGEEAPQGAGKAWLYVEPDGDVLPAQGILKVLGNLLDDLRVPSGSSPRSECCLTGSGMSVIASKPAGPLRCAITFTSALG